MNVNSKPQFICVYLCPFVFPSKLSMLQAEKGWTHQRLHQTLFG